MGCMIRLFRVVSILLPVGLIAMPGGDRALALATNRD